MPEETENYADRPHVMVVDDDRRIRDLLSRYLGEHGFVVVGASDAEDARHQLMNFKVDVLVVDVMMPGQNGFEFTRALREQSNVPVLLLTALGETQDRISGLEAGADDYLSKPFEPRELVLRLNAILKRTIRKTPNARKIRIGEWLFDPVREELIRGEDVRKLTSVEVTLLKVLGTCHGEVLSREALAERCGIDAGERTIDVQVTRLRRKIEEDTKNPRYLQTIRGKGYMLRAEEI
ncbi:MAG: response regulator [Alphaproteobacteria bacterium]|nr:response regulator [Alphaproteobacteria bacterium]